MRGMVEALLDNGTAKRCTACGEKWFLEMFRPVGKHSASVRSTCIRCQRIYSTRYWQKNAKRLNRLRRARLAAKRTILRSFDETAS